jgi:hypothetical protein
MNHILHNISLVILFFGIILITVYITKAYNTNKCRAEPTDIDSDNNDTDIYDERPNQIFKKMFQNTSVWANTYQLLDGDKDDKKKDDKKKYDKKKDDKKKNDKKKKKK